MRRYARVNLYDRRYCQEHQPPSISTIMATTLVSREVLCIDTIYSKP